MLLDTMSSAKADTRKRLLEAAWHRLEAAPRIPLRMADVAHDAGVSRQALYLHFPSRAELLIATARHLDDVFDVDGRFAATRAAKSGRERLDAFVVAWCGYIPHIYGIARAFLAAREEDEAADAAWSDRMGAVRTGCANAVKALQADKLLRPGLSAEAATDLLRAILSVEVYAQLVDESGWSQEDYETAMRQTAAAALLMPGPAPNA